MSLIETNSRLLVRFSSQFIGVFIISTAKYIYYGTIYSIIAKMRTSNRILEKSISKLTFIAELLIGIYNFQQRIRIENHIYGTI